MIPFPLCGTTRRTFFCITPPSKPRAITGSPARGCTPTAACSGPYPGRSSLTAPPRCGGRGGEGRGVTCTHVTRCFVRLSFHHHRTRHSRLTFRILNFFCVLRLLQDVEDCRLTTAPARARAYDTYVEGESFTRPVDSRLQKRYGRKWPQGLDLTLFPFDVQFCELQYGRV